MQITKSVCKPSGALSEVFDKRQTLFLNGLSLDIILSLKPLVPTKGVKCSSSVLQSPWE